MKYWIKNGYLLLKQNDKYSISKNDLFVENGRIKSIGTNTNSTSDDYEKIDATNQLIMPGLINSHTHAYMNLMKNTADDLPFKEWLFNKIIPTEAIMNTDDFYWGTLAGCIEMIKTGTTTYIDMHISDGQSAKAACDSGMRAFVGKCIRGEDLYGDALHSFKTAISEKDKYENELVNFILSPHSVYGCSEKLLRQISSEATVRNMLKHIHLSESENEIANSISIYTKSPVEFLQQIGFLDHRTLAAHCVKISDRDIDILKSTSTNVVTNPISNAKLGNGIAPATKMLDCGINLCLGTDSAASNNTLNLFREMGFFSLLHKATHSDPTVINVCKVLDCVSENPAKALGLTGKIGVIKEGAFADIIFLDLNKPSLFPNNNIISSLCYSADGSEVKSVMINGKFVMKNYEMTCIDQERVYYEINKIMKKYFTDRGF